MSETTNLKLKKHDNPSTNEEQFDVENYLNGNWDKIDENVGEVNTNISNINSKNTELEKELKEMQEDFYQNSIRGQASGEYIHVEDSSNCRARIGISGNSEQETRSGKNKLACPANFEETTFGIKVKQNNGIYSITGTTTSAGTCMTEKTIDNYTIESGDYLHLNNNVIENRVAFVFVFTDGTVDSTSLTEINRICNLENKVGKTISKVRIYCNTKDVNLSFEIKPMICKDSAVTDFERYGAMPSPDYPSEIKTVGSNMNLFDKDNANIIKAGFENNKIATGDTRRTLYLKIKPNTNYIVSKIISTRFDIATTQDIPSNGLVVNNKISKPDSSNITIKSNNNDNYIIVYFYNTSTDTVTEQEVLDSIKIEEGIVATPYSKYGQGCVKVTKCNENILDTSITKNVKNQNGEERIGYFCRITKTGTYYLMLNTANTLYFGKSTDLNSATTLIGSTSSTFSTTYDFNEGEYFVLWGTKTEKDKIMVILSNKQQKYIEHQEQSYIIPIQQSFKSIGDTRDTFIKKENKWYERHYIARRIFNGIANKFNSKHSSIYTDTRGFYQLNLPGKILGTNGSVAYGKSNYLKYKNGNAMDAIYQDCLWWENTSNYNYASIPFLSLTEANEWLVKLNDNGNPFYIDYVLAEPLDIECTEEQSNILDELNNARTYKNVTNITTDSKAILDLDYAKDLETLLNNTQALAVNNASEGV